MSGFEALFCSTSVINLRVKKKMKEYLKKRAIRRRRGEEWGWRIVNKMREIVERGEREMKERKERRRDSERESNKHLAAPPPFWSFTGEISYTIKHKKSKMTQACELTK